MTTRRRTPSVLPILVFSLFLASLLWSARRIRLTHVGLQVSWYLHENFSWDFAKETSITPATNSTLGFEKILAITTGTEWRLKGLRAAANLTNISIDFPTRSCLNSSIVNSFNQSPNGEGPRPSHGAAFAWLAHLDLLNYIIENDFSTALVVEDDIDWDIRLRDEIVEKVAYGVRNFTNSPLDDDSTPYGGNWDVIWMGHCGEWSQDWMPYYGWPDSTAPSNETYVGWAHVDMERLPEGIRTIHPTTNAVCTFAYGVTADGARKILEKLGNGNGEAFDVALSSACRAKDLDCVTVHPEIFHQYELPSEDGTFSEIEMLDNHDDWSLDDLAAHTSMGEHMGLTANIKHSARCQALFARTCQSMPSYD